MSILIKGVEMPSKCWSCPCCVDNGLIGRDREYFCSALDSDFEIDNLEQRLSACPLKEVPTPHGRLIDCESDFFPTAFRYNSTDYARGWNACLRSVLLSSTIIEAEVSE